LDATALADAQIEEQAGHDPDNEGSMIVAWESAKES
jgi:hypothetical protein